MIGFYPVKKSSKPVAAILAAAVAVIAFLANVARANAETTLIRELARNRQVVHILESGPESDPVAKSIQTAILTHETNRHRPDDVTITNVKDAPATGYSGNDSVITLLCTSEMPARQLPIVTLYVPAQLEASSSASTDSIVECHRGKDNYRVSLIAPDSERLGRLLPTLLSRSAPHYSVLPFSATFHSNKVAIFTSKAHQGVANSWGTLSGAVPLGCRSTLPPPFVFPAPPQPIAEPPLPCIDPYWNYIVWRPLSEYATTPKDALAGCNIVVAVDRSANEQVPADIQPALAGIPMTPLTAAIGHVENADHTNTIVFSAPGCVVLDRKLQRYNTVTNALNAPSTIEIKDFRFVGRSVLVVDAPRIGKKVLDDVTRSATALLSDKNVPLVERGSIENSITDCFGIRALKNRVYGPDTIKGVGRALGLRYIWLYKVFSNSGRTEWRSTSERVTQLPKLRAKPQPPVARQFIWQSYNTQMASQWETPTLNVEERRKAEMAYEADLALWNEDKRAYDEAMVNSPCEWRITKTKVVSGNIVAGMYLVDLSNIGTPLWQAPCQQEYRQEFPDVTTFTATGFKLSVVAPQVPPATDTWPNDTMVETAIAAAGQAIRNLPEEALLPSSVTNSGSQVPTRY